MVTWSVMQAIWPPAVFVALYVLLPLRLQSATASLLQTLLLGVAILAATVTLAYSVVLVFDALLFRIIARYEDDWKGGAAVDDILAHMHLKKPPDITRPLADRAAGTFRLAARQRVAFAVTAVAVVLQAIVP
jgi:hypothetical protein